MVRLDLLVVSAWIPISLWLCSTFPLDATVALFLYYGAPALYLCVRKGKNYKKIFLASLVLGVFLGMAFDITAEFHRVWSTTYALSPWSYPIVGTTPLGDVLWAFLIPFYTIVFYEHFFDDERRPRISRNARFAGIIGLCALGIVTLMLISFPNFPRIPYAYAFLGLLPLLPLVRILWWGTQSRLKLLLISCWFFVFNFVGELLWLFQNWGTYPGQYLGFLPLTIIHFPVEELLYWTLLSTPAFIVCYEWLFDDGK